MQNPILSILLGNQQNQNSTVQRLNAIKQIMAGKNPKEVYNNLLNTNAEFRDFVKKNEGKTVEQIAMEYDLKIDPSLLKSFL